MKIAIVSSHPIQYNAPLFLRLANQPGFEVKVFYTWEQSQQGAIYDPNFGREIRWDIPLLEGYEYHFTKNSAKKPSSSHFRGIVNPNLIKEIETFNPNGILLFGWSFQSHLKLMRHFKKKIPIFFRGDSTLLDEPEGFSVKKLLRRMLLSWIYHHIDFAFYTGTANKEYFITHGVLKHHLFYAPHAIDNERFRNFESAEELAESWRTELGIGVAQKVLLFSGKLEPKKNPEGLLKAFIELDLSDTHLIFSGSGILEEKLKELAANRTNIHFIGFQNQNRMPVVYRLGDVFVLPSNGPGETWGLALNEAMACNRMVIASDACGGALDLISSPSIGHVVRKKDLQDLKKNLKKTLEGERSELLQKGKLAGETINKFSYENVVKGFVQGFQGIKN